MAISRGQLVLFCLGTLWVSLLLIKVAEADSSDYAGTNIHTVNHEGGGGQGCKSTDPNKGNQCEENEDVLDVDEDFDDTYKVVNKMKVSLSGLGVAANVNLGPDEDLDSDEDLEHNERVVVLGH